MGHSDTRSAADPPEAPHMVNDPREHDPELAHFLDAVAALGAERLTLGPDAFLGALERLQSSFGELRRYRTERSLTQRLEAFADWRFDLVDEAEEYALACDEVVVLSMALGDASALAVPALKRAVDRASHVLS